jgi:hypothetical protein
MTAADLLSHCRALGVALSAGPAGRLTWEADADPPADLLAALAENKPAVLALLSPPTVPTVPWDQAEADYLVAEAVRWLEASGWPADADARRRLGLLADDVDDAYLVSDLAGLRQAVATFQATAARGGETVGGRWYAHGFEGMMTPFDEEGDVKPLDKENPDFR